LTEPDPNALDPAERKGRLEIRMILVLVLAVLVLGGLWVAINGSPVAERRALDSSDRGPAAVPTAEAPR
jgi:hypothetical protein